MDKIIHRTADDSYVIVKNGLPYHVPNEGEFAEEWAEVNAYALAHPDEVVDEEPYVPTQEEIAAAEEAETLAAQNEANEAAKQLILNKLIADAAQTLDFTEEEYATLALSNNIFPEWEEGAAYSAGTRVVYTPSANALSAGTGGRAIYEVTADTVATAEKTPDTDTEAYTALYALASGSVEIAEGSETAEADGGGEGNNANDSAAQISALNAKIDELTEALSELQNKTQD